MKNNYSSNEITPKNNRNKRIKTGDEQDETVEIEFYLDANINPDVGISESQDYVSEATKLMEQNVNEIKLLRRNKNNQQSSENSETTEIGHHDVTKLLTTDNNAEDNFKVSEIGHNHEIE